MKSLNDDLIRMQSQMQKLMTKVMTKLDKMNKKLPKVEGEVTEEEEEVKEEEKEENNDYLYEDDGNRTPEDQLSVYGDEQEYNGQNVSAYDILWES